MAKEQAGISPAGFEQQFVEIGRRIEEGPIAAAFGAELSRRYRITSAPESWNAWLTDLSKKYRLTGLGSSALQIEDS